MIPETSEEFLLNLKLNFPSETSQNVGNIHTRQLVKMDRTSPSLLPKNVVVFRRLDSKTCRGNEGNSATVVVVRIAPR